MVPGRVDVAGAITGTAGLALLVYGLSKAATGQDGVSHRGDASVVSSLQPAAEAEEDKVALAGAAMPCRHC